MRSRLISTLVNLTCEISPHNFEISRFYCKIHSKTLKTSQLYFVSPAFKNISFGHTGRFCAMSRECTFKFFRNLDYSGLIFLFIFLNITCTVPLTYSFTRYAHDIRTIIDRYTNVIPYTYDSYIQYDIG